VNVKSSTAYSRNTELMTKVTSNGHSYRTDD